MYQLKFTFQNKTKPNSEWIKFDASIKTHIPETMNTCEINVLNL